jgi:hypothetical protein
VSWVKALLPVRAFSWPTLGPKSGLATFGYAPSVPEAFYLPDAERFVSTELTRGPWSAEAQHAGPPAALIARAIERLEPGEELRTARFTMEILRPIPVAPLRIEARAVRSGRRTQYAEASLLDDRGEIARASAWRIRPADGAGEEIGLEPTPHSLSDAPEALPGFIPPWGDSYFTATEWRLASGNVAEPGPAAVWMRMRYPLVAGEEPSPLARVLVAADSGNGISWVLPFDAYVFINTELTIHLARMPEGEWVCLDARSSIGPEGVGLAESTLWDQRGRIGQGAQSLVVGRRTWGA